MDATFCRHHPAPEGRRGEKRGERERGYHMCSLAVIHFQVCCYVLGYHQPHICTLIQHHLNCWCHSCTLQNLVRSSTEKYEPSLSSGSSLARTLLAVWPRLALFGIFRPELTFLGFPRLPRTCSPVQRPQQPQVAFQTIAPGF